MSLVACVAEGLVAYLAFTSCVFIAILEAKEGFEDDSGFYFGTQLGVPARHTLVE